jgi:hypothetical protein
VITADRPTALASDTIGQLCRPACGFACRGTNQAFKVA